MLGPIDFVEVCFEGNNFDGRILAELSRAVESEAIQVVPQYLSPKIVKAMHLQHS